MNNREPKRKKKILIKIHANTITIIADDFPSDLTCMGAVLKANRFLDVRPIIVNGLLEWGVFDNDKLLQTFPTKQQALDFEIQRGKELLTT